MKKLLFKSFSIFLAMLMFSMQTFAFTSRATTSISKSEIQSVTEFDDSEIYAAFADVSDLDQYLAQNENMTYTDVSQENGTLLNGISSTTTLPFTASTDETVMGIPSFLWGCVLGWVGLLIVYLVLDNNKEQTKKALYGCIVGTVVSVVLYVVLFAAASSTVAANPYYY